MILKTFFQMKQAFNIFAVNKSIPLFFIPGKNLAGGSTPNAPVATVESHTDYQRQPMQILLYTLT